MTIGLRRYLIVVSALGLGAIAIAAGLDASRFRDPFPAARLSDLELFAVLTLLSFVASARLARSTAGGSWDAAFAVHLVAAAVLTPGLAGLACALGKPIGPRTQHQRSLLRQLFNRATLGVSALLGSVAFRAFDGTVGREIAPTQFRLIAGAVVAALVMSLVNFSTVVYGLHLGSDRRLTMIARRLSYESFLPHLALQPIGMLLVLCLWDRQPQGLLVAFPVAGLTIAYTNLSDHAIRYGRRAVATETQDVQATGHTVNRMLAAIAEKAGAIGAQASSVYMLDGTEMRLAGVQPSDSPPLPISVEDAARVLASALPLTGLRGSADEGPNHHISAIRLCTASDSPVGMLVIATDHRPSPQDLRQLTQLGDDVAAGLGNTDLFDRAQRAAQLEERVDVARDIHDSLAGDLTTAQFLLKHFAEEHRAGRADVRLVDHAVEILNDALQSTRETLRTLRTGVLPQRSIASDLEFQRVIMAEAYGIQLHISIVGPEDRLTPFEHHSISQLLRESLTNIRSHSGAANAWVTIDLQRPVRFAIDDDGQRMRQAEESLGKPSFGWRGMRERAAALGGTLAFDTSERGGLSVTFQMPAPSIE